MKTTRTSLSQNCIKIDSTASPILHSAMDTNMLAFWSAYGRAKGCVLQQAGDTMWFYTGIPHPLFNGMLLAILDNKDVQPTIDALQTMINAQGAPAFWWLGPATKPDNLGSILERFGLEPAGNIPGMALNLDAMDSCLPEIAGFTVETVDNENQRALWAQIAAIGNEFPDSMVEDMQKIETSICDSAYRAQHRYLGYLDGKPVASAALVLDAGVAGVYAIATIPEARQRGIGRFMTMLPLLEAKRQGYRTAILQASPMGYPIYKKLGFHDVCNYNLYTQNSQ